MRAILLASATATTLKGRRARSCVSQGYFPGFSLGAPQHSDRSNDENAPQVAISLLGDRSELLLAPGRILPRHQPDPGREIASRPEDSRVRHRRHDRSRPDNPDARDGLNPLARLARATLHLDPVFDRSDDTLQRLKLRSQHDDAGPCIDRQPRVLFVRHDRAVEAAGYIARGGQIIDATIVSVPKQRNTKEENEAIKAGKTPEGWEQRPAKNAERQAS